ncbi:MAG: hypothetical protein CL676_04120 [Bdellovibrionaceae bacterium]|nr:hypothetical protein [Pseudobdellovibrionaceae bacterium]|tara:strand:- start:134567 stop:137776 length:3210 start_codon:yes stop_codon:yes gene_type:complete
MKTYTFLLLHIFVASVLMGCTREAEERATLKFKLPQANLSNKANSLSTSTDTWGLADPTVISDISCYGILITDSKSEGACYDENENVAFNLGNMYGLFAAGSEISLDVNSGNAKTIRLIGMVGSSATDCGSSLSALNLSSFSMPQVLAAKTLDLAPGLNAMTMTASLTGKKLNHCKTTTSSFGPSSSTTTPTTPATVAITTPSSGSFVNASNQSALTVSGTCSGTGSLVTLSGDATGSTSCTAGIWTTTVDLTSAAEGAVSLTASYGDGTNAVQDSVSLVKDSMAPTVAFTSPSSGATISSGTMSSFSVTGTCSESGQSISISGDATGTAACSSSVWSTSLDFSGASDGTVSISATQTDLAGNISTSASISFNKSTSVAVLSISDGATYDFGTVANGASSNKTFTVTNSGSVSATAMGGSGLASPFTFQGGTFPGTGGDCGSTLAAAATCTIVVTYAPTATGLHTDTISVDYNDGSAAQSATRDIQGTGAAPAVLTISESNPYNYGTLASGASATMTFTVSNTGSVTATSIAETGLAAPFAFTGGSYPGTSGTCTPTLAAGANCTIDLSYSPTATGAHTDTINLTYNDGAAAQSVTHDVQGTGAVPASLTISNGPTYDFGNVTSLGYETVTLTITNSGGVAASSLSGSGLSGSFSFVGGGYPGTGGDCGGSLAAAASCDVVVKFLPTGLGPFTATLSMDYNNGAASQSATLDLQGTGINAFVWAAPGNEQTCGITDSGQGMCWGRNVEGNLGDSTTTDSLTSVGINGAYVWDMMSSNTRTTCGVINNGDAYCWGEGTGGQIGNGSSANQSVPALVSGSHSWVEVSVGLQHVCGLTAGGDIYCWGTNPSGQLGNNSTTTSNVPLIVSGGLTFIDVEVGGSSSCGITNTNAAYCWGLNTNGQLGDGTTTTRLVPTLVGGAHSWNEISVGGSHACGITTSGTLYCWGAGTSGQIGNAQSFEQTSPTQESFGATDWDYVTSGNQHNCAVNLSGDIYCWGANTSGQLGNGTTTTSNSPSLISATGPFDNVFSSYNHTCGVKSNGLLTCWGNNANGQLGTGSTSTYESTPLDVNP